jgi:N-6 DNA Methylase
MDAVILERRTEMAAAIEALHESTAFYTSEPVVDELLGMLDWPAGTRRLVDPSCGDGAFLVAALTKLLAADPYISDATVSHLLQGWEIHYFAVGEARARIARMLVAHGRTEAHATAMAINMVRHGDFLTDGPRVPTWDCVAGNPPFLRYANLPSILRDIYEATLPGHSQGDMLHSFIDRATLTLRAGGEIALVTSDRWLFSQCAANLRAVVGKRMGLHHLARLDCSSAFYRAKSRRSGQPPRIHPVAVVLRELEYCQTALTSAPIYPEADDDSAQGCAKLSSVANVRLAPWLGKHGLFVIDKATAQAAGIPEDMLIPAVDTDNLKGGVFSAPTKFAIRTLRSEEPPAEVTAHLERNMHLLARTKVRKTKRWLPPESFEKLDLSEPCLLIPRIACSLRPVRIPAGVLPLDHGISIVCAGEMSLDELEAALSHPAAEAWVRARAPRLENGYFSLTTTMLRDLPIFTD